MERWQTALLGFGLGHPQGLDFLLLIYFGAS